MTVSEKFHVVRFKFNCGVLNTAGPRERQTTEGVAGGRHHGYQMLLRSAGEATNSL